MSLTKKRFIIENFNNGDTFLIKNDNYHTDEPFIILSCCYQNSETNVFDSKKLNNDIENFGLNNVILYNMATHPQYPGMKLSKYKNDPFSTLNDEDLLSEKEFKSFVNTFFLMKNITEKKDNSNKIITPPFIKHIYCDLLNNIGHKKNNAIFPELQKTQTNI